jgi:hypothetical protein
MQNPGGYNIQQQQELVSILSRFVLDKIEIDRLLCMLGVSAQPFCIMDGNYYFEQLKFILNSFTKKDEVVRCIEEMYSEITNEECFTDCECDYSDDEDGETGDEWDEEDYDY